MNFNLYKPVKFSSFNLRVGDNSSSLTATGEPTDQSIPSYAVPGSDWVQVAMSDGSVVWMEPQIEENPLIVEILYNTSQDHKRLAIAISAMPLWSADSMPMRDCMHLLPNADALSDVLARRGVDCKHPKRGWLGRPRPVRPYRGMVAVIDVFNM